MLRGRHMEHFLRGRFGAVLLAGVALGGCASVPNPALERARSNYESARQDPQVNTHAPVALYEAEKTLRQAEQTWESSGNRAEVEHLIYLTKQKVEIARAVAGQRVAEEDTLKLSQEREKVLLEARSRIAVDALQEAQDRAVKAAKAREEAETKAREAARARQEAEDRAREAIRARRDAEEAGARAKQLEEQLAQLKAEHTERGLVLNLGDVLFEFAKADLKSGALRNLEPLVTFLKEYPARNIVIEGHTDDIGSESFNLGLSERRANAVRDFLIRSGIAAERISSRGYGEAFPVASNQNEAGRQKNRRVEVVILREGEKADQKVRTR